MEEAIRIVLNALAFAVLFFLLSCSRRQAAADQPLVQEEPALAALHVADPKASIQLLKGWHAVEHGSWRWTEKQFAVALKIPAPGKPALLKLEFAIPEASLARLHSIGLSATANGVALSPETYTRPGNQIYSRTLPSSATAGDLVRIDFALDKALLPGEADGRELGLVVTSVGLR